MIARGQYLSSDLFTPKLEYATLRHGFGQGLLEAGQQDAAVVALCADLTESTQMELFADKFPERFIEVGIAEQNLVTVASGLAAVDKKPFASSYAAFSPGRNWEQIRTTITLNNQPVVIVGSHAGLSVGPDGATHQVLEDIALMRTLPNMQVVVPCDTHEAYRATLALAASRQPAYIRLAREKTPVVTTPDTPFELGKAQIFYEGEDVTLVASGPLMYEALLAARELEEHHIRAEVVNLSTIKPLDSKTLLTSFAKTGAVVTIEESQRIGGVGGAVAELLATHLPLPMEQIGVDDRFGQSGAVAELWQEYGLTCPYIVAAARKAVERKTQ